MSYAPTTAATPDGRVRGQYLSNGICPVNGADRQGPTAVIKSAGRLGLETAPNGASHTMSFSPSLLRSPENRRKMAALLRAYGQVGGTCLQLNAVSPETLRAAQDDPDSYQNLLVRITGYNAYFVMLGKEIQDEIIARDSHERFDPTASFQEYDPGPNKYGCQDHPVGSKMIAAGHAEMMAAVTDAGEDLEADVAEMKAALERDEIDPESLRTASLDGVSMAALEANGEMLALSGEVDAELLDAEVRTYPEILKDGPPPYGECDWGGCDEPAVEWRPATGSPDQRLPVCARHTARAELSYQSVTDDRGIEPSESPHHPGGLGNREHPGLGNQDAGAGLEYTAETDATLQDSKRRQHEAAKADAAAEAEADPDPADTADLEDLG